MKGPADGGCGVEAGGLKVVLVILGGTGTETKPEMSSIPTLPPELLIDVRILMAKEAPPMLVMTRLLSDTN